jgi:hypothetical protein
VPLTTVGPKKQERTLIDAEWITRWGKKYPPEDDDVLHAVQKRVRARGYYDRDDLMAVGEWKLTGSYWPKHRKTMDRNTDEMIRDITRTAQTAPLSIQHRIMCLLDGVGEPVASALLMTWDDAAHTVIDRKAVKSLQVHGEIAPGPEGALPPYLEYLDVCQRIRQRCGCDLRGLDRALYKANGSLDLPPQPPAHA